MIIEVLLTKLWKACFEETHSTKSDLSDHKQVNAINLGLY